jgi:hypothetical protein
MSTEDHIWALVAKRLANEATLEELQELDELLKKYSDTDGRVKVIADWWRAYIQGEIDRRGAILFEKIKERIRTMQNK